jgi:transposase
MLEETNDCDQIIQRVAALDVGKAEVTCCVRVPGQGGSGPADGRRSGATRR